MEKTSNNTRTYLFPKNCGFIQDRGLLFIEKGKTGTLDGITSFLRKIKGIKQVDREEESYAFIFENKKGFVSIVINESGKYKNIKFCLTMSLQIPFEDNSFELMKDLISKIHDQFDIKIYSFLFHDMISIEELKSTNLKEAYEKAHLNYVVKYYLFLIHQNKAQLAKKFIKDKIKKSDLYRVKRIILGKNYLKFGYIKKLVG